MILLLGMYILVSSQKVFNGKEVENKKVIKIRNSRSTQPAASNYPCKKQQVTQYFSAENSPYVSIRINICAGGCLCVSVPSNKTFINPFCMACQVTDKVLKDVVFFKGTPKETTIQVDSATGCKCQL